MFETLNLFISTLHFQFFKSKVKVKWQDLRISHFVCAAVGDCTRLGGLPPSNAIRWASSASSKLLGALAKSGISPRSMPTAWKFWKIELLNLKINVLFLIGVERKRGVSNIVSIRGFHWNKGPERWIFWYLQFLKIKIIESVTFWNEMYFSRFWEQQTPKHKVKPDNLELQALWTYKSKTSL